VFEEAMINYQKAADFFIAENAASTAAKCTGKIAYLAAKTDPPDYERAAQEFEKVGRESLASNLLKFGAKGNFFNATICTLARGDIVAADGSLNRFKEMDYTFGGSRECKLLEDVVTAYKDGNMDAFTDAVYNFDQISKLDPWRTTILLKIKTEMQKSQGEGSDLT
jgi:alpha-soluble NSF attachment protein